jgi:predicted phage terminase large subunit-like protein
MADQAVDIAKLKYACEQNLEFLCRHILWNNNPNFQDSWAPFHNDMHKIIRRKSRRKLILVPRGHLKSEVITKGWTVQQLLKNPNARILLAHEVWDKSREMLSQIKEWLTNKSYLPQIYGQFESARWNADEIVIRQRVRALSAPSVGTTGVEAEMTSTHYDIIICDDLQGLQNYQTPEQRAKVKRFYRSLIDLLEPDGTLVVIGTRWHQDDLYAEILEKEGEYYDKMIRKVVEDGKIIFPKKFALRFDQKVKGWVFDENSLDFIQYLKTSKGAEYYSQYENNPIDEENQLFKRGMFQYWNQRPLGLYISMPVDLAISEKQSADYTAIPVLGMDKEFNIYVLDYIKGRWGPSEIIGNIFQMQAKWKPNAVGMETNGFQRTLKLAVEEAMRHKRQYFPIDEIRNGPTQTKEQRVKSLEPFYRQGKVYHAAWMRGKELEDELLAFPKGKHDDLIDAMAAGLTLLSPGIDSMQRPDKEGTWDWAAQEARRMQTGQKDFFGLR